jgi:DedD protein
MAGTRKTQGETVLGARHVLGLFLGIVVLCGVFFALGYVMGRDQSRSSTHTTARTRPSDTADTASVPDDLAPGAGAWDFFPQKNSASGVTTPGLPQSGGAAAMTARTADSSVPPSRAPGGRDGEKEKSSALLSMTRTDAVHLTVLTQPPAGSGESLQVAALSNTDDALALAEFLRRRGYPAFVWGPGPDHLFRVQVGPYPDDRTAEQARRALAREGFKTIRKR